MSELGVSTDGQPSDDFITIPDVPIAPDSSRVSPQDVASGLRRGAQLNTGADGFPQVLQGNQQTFGNGFFVAKPGNDVTQVTNPANFIFNSNQDIFKIVLTGTTSITTSTPGNSVNITVNHNLGFVPIGMFYINNSAQFAPLPFILWGSSSQNLGIALLSIYVLGVDNTSIYFQANSWSTEFNNAIWPIKYYLLQETAN